MDRKIGAGVLSANLSQTLPLTPAPGLGENRALINAYGLSLLDKLLFLTVRLSAKGIF